MPDSLIDLKALLVEREDCDAGTVQQLRNGLAQGGSQYRALRDVADVLKKKLDSASGPAAKRVHLKLGIAQFFLGHLTDSIENLKQAEGALSSFYLGRALASKHDYDEALKAFDKAEKSGYTASQVNLQRAGIYRQKGDFAHSRAILNKLSDLASHNAEYHFQLACGYLPMGSAVRRFVIWSGRSNWIRVIPGRYSSSATPTTLPATTRKRSATTSAASRIHRFT